jgi:transcriptional regulator with XRE-family HTH domain
MIVIMPSKAPVLFPAQTLLMTALGERLRDARLRRGFSAATVCARADISRPTLTKVEAGNAAVTLGTYLQVLRVLGLEQDLSLLAADDVVGRRLQDAKLPRRKRVARQPKEPT